MSRDKNRYVKRIPRKRRKKKYPIMVLEKNELQL